MALPAYHYVVPHPYEPDSNGVPIAGARIFFFLSGTTTQQDTYTAPDLATPNTNPVVADANGRFPDIWLSPANEYGAQLWTAATIDDPVGAQIWAADPLSGAPLVGGGGSGGNTTGFTGEIRTFVGLETSIPAGWLPCDGRAINRSTYAALFTIIGTIWGNGDGGTTFNIPDFRGRALFGADDLGGTAANRLTSGVAGFAGTLGSSGGDQSSQAHTHDITVVLTGSSATATTNAVSAPTLGDGTAAITSFAGGWNFFNPATVTVSFTGASATGTASVSGGGHSENVPPAAVVLYIICTGL